MKSSFISTPGVKGYRPAAKVHFNPGIQDRSTSEVPDCNLTWPPLKEMHPRFFFKAAFQTRLDLLGSPLRETRGTEVLRGV